MIFLPAIAAALAPLVNGALAVATVAAPIAGAAAVGATVGGATCAVTGTVSKYHEHGSISREDAEDVAKDAAGCAAGGAAISTVGVLLAPAIPAAGILTGVRAPAATLVDDVAAHAANAIDDVAKSAVGSIDDVASVAGSAVIVDDTAKPFISRVGQKLSAAGSGIGSGFRLARNKLNARFFTRLQKGSGNNGYVYVMDDVTTPGRFKFGKTIQPDKRLQQVQNHLNKTVGGKVEYSCIISTDDMKLLETSLKAQYKPQNIVGHPAGTEWFVLSAAQVAAACSH